MPGGGEPPPSLGWTLASFEGALEEECAGMRSAGSYACSVSGPLSLMSTLRGVMVTEWGATLPSPATCSAPTALWSTERCDGPGVTRCDVNTEECALIALAPLTALATLVRVVLLICSLVPVSHHLFLV